MRLKTRTPEEKYKDMRKWRAVFAYLPVKVADGEWRWLERVHMRYYRKPMTPFSFSYKRQYRPAGSNSEGFPLGLAMFGEGAVPREEYKVSAPPPPMPIVKVARPHPK